jgi:hypothetical protein
MRLPRSCYLVPKNCDLLPAGPATGSRVTGAAISIVLVIGCQLLFFGQPENGACRPGSAAHRAGGGDESLAVRLNKEEPQAEYALGVQSSSLNLGLSTGRLWGCQGSRPQVPNKC